MRFWDNWACPVLDEESGKSLEWRQLNRHPWYKDVWNTLFSNKLVVCAKESE